MLDIPYETKTEKELKAQLVEKEKQIQKLQMQMDLFERIHKMQDKSIFEKNMLLSNDNLDFWISSRCFL